MPTLKLTQDLITTGLQCPPSKHRIEFCDSELSGFYVEVRATSPGAGTYYLRYKDEAGKTCHQKIGRTSQLSLGEARRRAKILKAEIQLGADPRGEAKAQKAVITLEVLFEEHYLPYVKPRKRSWKRDVELFRRIQPVFGARRLNEITRQQIQTFHTALLGQHLAAATCDHHLKLLRHALNLAIDWGMLEKNPAARVPLFNRDNKVENYLDDDRLAVLLGVLRTDENRAVCQIATFLLSTGARLNEALSARWGQIDRDTRVWRIPASNSKSKRVRSVPLNDSALEVLRQVGTEGRHEHVFVNEQTGQRYTTIHKVWGRLRREAGVPFLRIHDLRHLYASFLVNSGRTLYEVQQILGHSDPSVTQRYAHLSSRSLQEAANSASIVIREASKVEEVLA
jgi:integrase